MADANIKKVRIPYADLPPINASSEGYNIRYKFVSDDRNRTSHWSPLYIVVPQFIYVPGQIRHSSGGQIISYSWDSVNILKTASTFQTINNKALTNNIATITTSEAHYLSVGNWVTVSDVDSVFNGTYQITAVTADTFSYYKNNANITSEAVSPSGTYSKNTFVAKALDYDIWLRWDRNDGGDWIYKERIQTTTISYPHPSFYTINGAVQSQPPNRVSVEIYLKGYPVSRSSTFLKVYERTNDTI